MEQTIVEADLRGFFQRLGHVEHGCSEWVLVDPRSREIRGTGFFTDPDLLLMSLQAYSGSYNVQVCRNPRPRSCQTPPGGNNQFDRARNRAVALDQLEVLDSTVVLWRSKGRSTQDQVATIAANLMARVGINEYSVETAGPLVSVRIRFQASPLRRFGSLEDCRTVFARLEEHFRERLTQEEKADVEIVPNSSPELHDSVIGVLQPSTSGWVMGRWLYAPADQPDATLERMLTDLVAGKPLATTAGHSTTVMAVRTEGLISDWSADDPYGDDAFNDGGGIIPKGGPLKIESEEGKQAKGQIENLETLSREAYLRRCRAVWRAPVATKPLNGRTAGGARPGDVWAIEGNSYKAVQDWMLSGMENILRAQDAMILWASSRLLPGAFHARGVERLSGKALEDIEGIADMTMAIQAQAQFRQQFKRLPMLFPHGPSDSLGQILTQMRAFRHSDEAISHLPGLAVIDGLDDFSPDGHGLREVRYLAQDAHCAVWVSSIGTAIQESLCDLHVTLVLGEAPIRAWLESPQVAGDTDLALSRQVLPRLFGDTQGRIPCALRARHPHEMWTAHAYHLYYPGTGRFQNIVPKKEG
ncbi:MAG: hypothetical protein IPK50_15145 [Fibrobacterota bacterium]|nr:hypothetical protein [Fibrobacterota bacterium]QQS03628.1 MAG: hypothetical protein IPK50_15145 [Fibrobacterota bacterium]